MVKKRVERGRGFTLLELIVAMSVFGVFLVVFFVLTAEMRSWEKRLPVNFMRNPQVVGVIARMRRDVQDMRIANDMNPYIEAHDGHEMSDTTLIFEAQQPNGGKQQIVWDFSEHGVAKRISYNVGMKTEWAARGLPKEIAFTIGAVELPSKRPYGVRLMAKDNDGRLAIDQVLQPRAHQ